MHCHLLLLAMASSLGNCGPPTAAMHSTTMLIRVQYWQWWLALLKNKIRTKSQIPRCFSRGTVESYHFLSMPLQSFILTVSQWLAALAAPRNCGGPRPAAVRSLAAVAAAARGGPPGAGDPGRRGAAGPAAEAAVCLGWVEDGELGEVAKNMAKHICYSHDGMTVEIHRNTVHGN